MAADPLQRPAIERLGIVVVTYNRAGFLDRLLTSVAAMTTPAWKVVVVDNASTDATSEVLTRWRGHLGADVLVPHRLEANTGGAGGFAAGIERALAEGAEWMWLMDDDVEVIPDALARLAPWLAKYRCVTGRKYDFDGSPFRWQNRFSEFLGVPLALRGDPFGGDGWFEQTAGNFEGMAIHRSVVEQIGLPDPRFFIVWDDAVYGWLAHLVTPSVVVDEFVLRRMRVLTQLRVGERNLNATGDLYRFYVMRNRALVRHYMRDRGRLNAFGFALGTCLVFGKEVVRTIAVERKVSGVRHLLRGALASRRLARERGWTPMPPLSSAGTAPA
jgi:rhamnopyranosyl-N-acetylglucosaminyl-diphospho-decaprenol beta-1,3/1,4-galactofuranosyltransferase